MTLVTALGSEPSSPSGSASRVSVMIARESEWSIANSEEGALVRGVDGHVAQARPGHAEQGGQELGPVRHEHADRITGLEAEGDQR